MVHSLDISYLLTDFSLQHALPKGCPMVLRRFSIRILYATCVYRYIVRHIYSSKLKDKLKKYPDPVVRKHTSQMTSNAIARREYRYLNTSNSLLVLIMLLLGLTFSSFLLFVRLNLPNAFKRFKFHVDIGHIHSGLSDPYAST